MQQQRPALNAKEAMSDVSRPPPIMPQSENQIEGESGVWWVCRVCRVRSAMSKVRGLVFIKSLVQ